MTTKSKKLRKSSKQVRRSLYGIPPEKLAKALLSPLRKPITSETRKVKS